MWDGISGLFWFAFLWWLRMLNNFSGASPPFGIPQVRILCLAPSPFFNGVIWFSGVHLLEFFCDWVTSLRMMPSRSIHLPEEYRMAEKHLKKCSTSLVIREMQIKTTLWFHLTPVRMVKIKNSGDNRYWWGCGERGTLLHCWWDFLLIQPLWKSV